MKQFQIQYTDRSDFANQLEGIKRLCDSKSYSTVIFYLNWSQGVSVELDDATSQIEWMFPGAIYYGNEASGNISEGKLSYGINVTCIILEGKACEAELVWVEKGTGFGSLQDLWDYCRTKSGLRAVELIPSISYLETLAIDGNVPGLDKDILIFGGASVNYDNATFDADIIAKGHPRTKDGMAAILFSGSGFQFDGTYVLGWKGLGKDMDVTDCEGKCIKEINGMPAYSIYEKYLNLSIDDSDTLVFPLILDEDGVEYIRTPQIINPDKSMLMFADIAKGSKVRIAYGDKNTILDILNERAKTIAEFRPEVIKAFSCAGRRLFWGNAEISKETEILEQIAPVFGFYTGGEIMMFGDRLRVLNQTLCIISLRENESAKYIKPSSLKEKAPDKSLVSRLAYFIEKVSEEQHEALSIAEQEMVRNDAIIQVNNASKWTYEIDEKDNVVAAYYSDKTRAIVKNSIVDDPMAWLNLVHPDDVERAKASFMAAIHDHSGNTTYDTTFRIIGKDGEYYWCKSAGKLLRHEDGTAELFGMSLNFNEQIAEKEKQQQILKEALDAAESASRSKTSFLFNMSHDIRTPINAISGFTTMAKKYAGDKEKVMDYLNKIESSGHQLFLLINQVLEMSRIESGKIEWDEHAINVKEKFDTMVALFTSQAISYGIEFHPSLEDVKHFYVDADEARMSQITLNIAGNALKYTPEGGKIDFILKEVAPRKEGCATFVFTVADTGIGMTKEFMEKLFEPFSREKNTTLSKVQGTGLGLSIVKSLVDYAGGEIEVQSEVGKGTRFDITLDFKIADKEEVVAMSLPEDTSLSFDFNGKRALLVEDNELNREIAKFILGDKGVQIDEAEDGDIAVDKVRQMVQDNDLSRYDFILMDVQMPRMSGLEATVRIREILEPLGLHIPIIALSANAFEEDRQLSIMAGMDDHVAKPIDVEQLWSTLAKYI